ncbi:TPA: hypothetical protein N0F65_007577 [Lagenidium giganteum]|uniref:Transposase Tc1-like domain-containing protein n=1 Tax=Lagenidium giganteum TaxID=4803 RepID=A0AAV2ZIZ8_9STRA|nr:TPA: hypothetical protein N0F65_007577 [Lagenidium giganteum]
MQLPNAALAHGSMALAAKTFGCHRNTAREIWRRHQDGTVVQRGGSKPRYDAATLKAAVASVDVLERQTVRAAAAMQDYIKPDGCLRRRTANVKPTFTDAQRQDRVRFALAHVQRPLGLRRRYFVDMYDTVSSKFILTEDEDIPHITCPNKRFITKLLSPGHATTTFVHGMPGIGS